MTLNVLYVDDEEDLREIATLALELDPLVKVRTCASGVEALDLLGAWMPDLVLLDLMLPHMDGPEIFRAIRERFGSRPPIAFITARTEPAERERLFALGALDIITKPFDPLTLASKVRACVENG